MKSQHEIPTHLRVEIEASEKGLDLDAIRRRLRMKPALFSLGKSGQRKAAHQRILDFIRKAKPQRAKAV